MTDAGAADGLPAVETAVDGMHVMPFGGLPADALHSATGLAALVRETKERYDLVICDAPPVCISPRATLLGRAADGVVLVVRRGRTTAHAIEQVLRAWDGTGLSFFGFVLNGTRAAAGERGVHRRRRTEVVPV